MVRLESFLASHGIFDCCELFDEAFVGHNTTDDRVCITRVPKRATNVNEAAIMRPVQLRRYSHSAKRYTNSGQVESPEGFHAFCSIPSCEVGDDR